MERRAAWERAGGLQEKRKLYQEMKLYQEKGILPGRCWLWNPCFIQSFFKSGIGIYSHYPVVSEIFTGHLSPRFQAAPHKVITRVLQVFILFLGTAELLKDGGAAAPLLWLDLDDGKIALLTERFTRVQPLPWFLGVILKFRVQLWNTTSPAVKYNKSSCEIQVQL